MNKSLFKSVLYIVICSYITIGATAALAQFALKSNVKSFNLTQVKDVEDTSRNQQYVDSKNNSFETIDFKHGDVSWLPSLASQAGWPSKTHERLAQIILRESGGCPNRRGGDKVDKNCNITGVSEWNHRSDTGLLQINGVNYDMSRNKWAVICLQMNICTQEPLLDPFTNLKAGKILYDLSGWDPWDPCKWNPKLKNKCSFQD